MTSMTSKDFQWTSNGLPMTSKCRRILGKEDMNFSPEAGLRNEHCEYIQKTFLITYKHMPPVDSYSLRPSMEHAINAALRITAEFSNEFSSEIEHLHTEIVLINDIEKLIMDAQLCWLIEMPIAIGHPIAPLSKKLAV